MANVNPNGVKTVDARIRPATPGDEIVISGVSGRFPSAKTVTEFAHKLYSKVGSESVNFFYDSNICTRNQNSLNFRAKCKFIFRSKKCWHKFYKFF